MPHVLRVVRFLSRAPDNGLIASGLTPFCQSDVHKSPCPVHRLAVEASEIVAALNLIEQRQLDDKSLPRDHDNEGHLNDRLDAIQTQASFCVPQSLDGAAFLLAMAASHRDVIVGSTFASDHERDEWERRCKGASTPRHVRLYHYHYMTDCPAWHDLNAVARAIYCEIARRYAGAGSNNGRIPYSLREAAAELKISRATASRALTALEDHGFIVPMIKGAFSLKKRHATEWRLTEFPCDVTHTLTGSKEFMRWAPSPGGSLATAPLGARFASPPPLRAVHPPGKLVVSL